MSLDLKHLTVACPICKSKPGQKCTYLFTKKFTGKVMLAVVHKGRRLAYEATLQTEDQKLETALAAALQEIDEGPDLDQEGAIEELDDMVQMVQGPQVKAPFSYQFTPTPAGAVDQPHTVQAGVTEHAADVVQGISCPTCKVGAGVDCEGIPQGFVHPKRAKAYATWLISKTKGAPDVASHGANAVACPTCQRQPGYKCRTPQGTVCKPHVRRQIAAGLLHTKPALNQLWCTNCQQMRAMHVLITSVLRRPVGTEEAAGYHNLIFWHQGQAIQAMDHTIDVRCDVCQTLHYHKAGNGGQANVWTPEETPVIHVCNSDDEEARWSVVPVGQDVENL